jgi:hypothetical protein
MIDHGVQSLLEEAIDSPVKLQLLLLFHDNPWLQATPSQIAQRACRDIWSTLESLGELAEAGILNVCDCKGGEPIYSYRPEPHRSEVICRLAHCYADPIKRDALHRSVRELASASYSPIGGEYGWYAQYA